MDKLTSDRLKVMRYIDKHPTVVLGTLDEYGRPHGSVVHAVSGDHTSRMHVYFLTKTDTAKYRHLRARPAVSLTSFDEGDISALEVQGHAEVEDNPRVIDAVMKQLTRTHTHMPEWLPPIAKLRAGKYIMIGVTVSHARLAEFKDKTIGDETIFTDTK